MKLPKQPTGETLLAGFPSVLRTFTLSGASNDGVFRHLRVATADRGGSDKPFEKGLSENFSPCGSREV